MEFKSQICTTKEQSEKLLKLGLKKETADMMYISDGRVPEEYKHYDLVPEYYESFLEDMVHIPAWSLHRLMEIMYKGDDYGFVSIDVHNRNIESLYELVIAQIDGLVKIKHFNIQYLEE